MAARVLYEGQSNGTIDKVAIALSLYDDDIIY
jgi:hypothetical protein